MRKFLHSHRKFKEKENVALMIHLYLRKRRGENMSEIGQVAGSPKEIHPLLLESKIPKLTLTTAKRHFFDLHAAIREKPTILVYYRGGW